MCAVHMCRLATVPLHVCSAHVSPGHYVCACVDMSVYGGTAACLTVHRAYHEPAGLSHITCDRPFPYYV